VLESITIQDLRGYGAADLAFGPGPHLVVGPNAAGKTSLLEAIVLLAWGRSHRTSTDAELIRWGADVARVEGHAGPEAQVAALSDDIAYNNHDIDDGLRAGLFTLAEIRADVPMVERVLITVERDYPAIDEFRTQAEMVRRLIGVLADDLVWESTNRLNELKPQTPEDIRAAGRVPGSQVGRELQAARGHADRLQGHLAARAHV